MQPKGELQGVPVPRCPQVRRRKKPRWEESLGSRGAGARPCCSALFLLAWTQLKARCVAPPVFTLRNLQFTVIKSFNTVIIFLARAALAVSDTERSRLTAA